MSLIITETSKLGVAMAADSAVSVPHRVYIGFQKLLPIYAINAGISFWGAGEINNEDTDIWLQKFIDNEVKKNMKLWDMAVLLADSLNKAFGEILNEPMGIHVGGYDEKNGIKGPAFYHVHNSHYHYEIKENKIVQIWEENPPIREFRAHEDCPPGKFSLTRNGDYKLFAFLQDSLNKTLASFYKLDDFEFPYPPTLSSRGELLRFWINFMSEIFRLSNQRERILPEPTTGGDAHIGGPVTVLTISEEGIQEFYRR